ncbi:degringolade [Cochliomyia hominivorax]
MTSRKRQINMEKENRKKNYAAQSPKDFDDESVDEMLANVDQFIEGVYRDLSISPPQSSSLSNNSTFSTARRAVNDNSSFSSDGNSPAGTSVFDRVSLDDSTSVVSPRTRRNLDADIERINRICDNVDRNLRSIGLFMNTSSDASPDVLNSNLTTSPTATASNYLTTLSLNNSPIAAADAGAPTTKRRGRPRRRSSGMPSISSSNVIDLSDSHTQTPEVIRRPPSLPANSNINDDEDDDVILVSANIHPVVDLCTPGGYQDAPRARSSINQRQLSRRRLNHQDEDAIETCGSGPSPVRRRRTEYSKPNEYKTSLEISLSDTEKSYNATGSGSNGAGHTPFMCPVCMESCLQRQPTSTRCGHVFCKECIEHAIRLTHKCPMCNTKISKSQIFRIYL